MSILLTGFEPYIGGINASQILIESLRENPPVELENYSNLLRYHILPVSTQRIEPALVEALDEHDPDICLLIGQAPRRNKIMLERLAINISDFDIPDMDGLSINGAMIDPDGPAAYWSTLP